MGILKRERAGLLVEVVVKPVIRVVIEFQPSGVALVQGGPVVARTS